MSFFMLNFLYSPIFLQVTKGSLLDTSQNLGMMEVLNRAIAFGMIGAGTLCIAFIFWGGISFILSGGDEEKIKSAVSTIRYSIFGLIITILSVIVVNAVGRVVGINTTEYIKFENIVQTIQNITQDISTDSKSNQRSLD